MYGCNLRVEVTCVYGCNSFRGNLRLRKYEDVNRASQTEDYPDKDATGGKQRLWLPAAAAPDFWRLTAVCGSNLVIASASAVKPMCNWKNRR